MTRTLFDVTEFTAPPKQQRTAAQARDAGIATVTANNESFMEKGLRAIRGLPPDQYQGEQIRVLLLAQKSVEPPKTHHAWGSLINAAIKAGVLKTTGEYRATKEKRTHAHKTQVYVKE